MPKMMSLCLLVLIAAAWPALAPAQEQAKPASEKKAAVAAAPKPLHPPLDCLKTYEITEYPIMGWCFHGKGGGGYDEAYVRAAKAAGFNVLVESQEMLKPAKKVGGVKIMAVAFRFNTWRIERQVLNRFGADHPSLLGFVLDDNCRRISGNSKAVATWLKKNHPRLVPYVSENQDTRNQVKTDLRILGTQNWRMKRGDVRGANGYCGRMEMDRHVANIYRMSFWPLWYGMANRGSIRFQLYAAIAYGAQGVLCFAYTPNRPHWKPNGWVTKTHADAAVYVHDVIGRHVLGTRSMGVLHSSGMGRARRSNKWIARMDPGLIAGMLFTEKLFYAKDPNKVPTYAMVVRKEFVRGKEPPARTVRVDFTPAVSAVEVLERKTGTDADNIRKIEPAFSAAVTLLTGDGRLLVLNPDLGPALGPLEAPYLDVCKRAGDLMARARATRAAEEAKAEPTEPAKRKGKKGKPKAKKEPPLPKAEPLAEGEFGRIFAAIEKDVRALAGKKADSAQIADTVARLEAALTYLKAQSPEEKK